LTLVSQSAGCNRAHAVDERLARWLLITHDRIGRDQFPITQEFIGLMLGVSRGTVNTSASLLQRAGFIRYQRGRITVADRKGLESAACNCYAVIRREFDRLLE
jgi:CRP-like cAMP-binding protein